MFISALPGQGHHDFKCKFKPSIGNDIYFNTYPALSLTRPLHFLRCLSKKVAAVFIIQQRGTKNTPSNPQTAGYNMSYEHAAESPERPQGPRNTMSESTEFGGRRKQNGKKQRIQRENSALSGVGWGQVCGEQHPSVAEGRGKGQQCPWSSSAPSSARITHACVCVIEGHFSRSLPSL